MGTVATIAGMKTAIATRYGPPDVLRIVDTPRPEPKPDQVLVRVMATAVTAADARIRGGRFPKGFAPFARLAFGVTKQRQPVLGVSYSGVIESVGSAVTGFAPGDEVCGMGGAGAWTEYVCKNPAKAMTRKPAGVSHDQAAATLFGGAAALYFLRDRARLEAGQRVLVNGAAGVVGSSAVQIARFLGAEVTGVARGETHAFLAEIGAEHQIDYRQASLNSLNERFGLVFDTAGTLSIADGRRLLTPNGHLILVAANLFQMFPRKQVLTGMAPENGDDMAFLLTLVEQGAITPAIDSVWSLDDIVAANRRFETGGRCGVVLVHPTG